MREIAQGTGVQFGPRAAAAFLGLPDHLFHSIRTARTPLRAGAVHRARIRPSIVSGFGAADSPFLVG